MRVLDAVRRMGGIAAAHELRGLGCSAGWVRSAALSGEVVRPRKGWYADPMLSRAALGALRVGGRLGCLSAAAHYGVWTLDDGDLHVSVSAHTARLRAAGDRRQRLTGSGERVHVHWSDSRTGSRVAVDPEEMVRQVISCQPERAAFVVLESAVRQQLLDPMNWFDISVPMRFRPYLERASGLSDSGIESLIKLALIRLGLPFRQQVRIRGVGVVDFLVGECLVIEVDGVAFHRDGRRERRRDGDLVLAGYRFLHFWYEQAVHGIEWVEQVLLAAYVRGDHLTA